MISKTDNSILFTSPIGRQTTELLATGDNLILYTESNELYKRFKDWKAIERICPYLSGNNLVGVGLYFPRSSAKALVWALEAYYHRRKVSRGKQVE